MTTTTLRTTAILKTDIAGSTPRFHAMAEADLAVLLSESAALAAMSMQEELRLGQANSGDDRLAMRVVITVGDVLHQEGALVGDAVVLATRIEAVTPPDEIYLSAAAWLTMNHAEIRTSFVNGFAVKGFVEFTPLIETAATTVVETVLDGLHDAITDVCHEFGGVVRFSAGDGYCLTFTDAGRAVAGLERLVSAWDVFARKADVRCAINIGVHKGTLYAFRSFLHSSDLNVAASTSRRCPRTGRT